MMCSKRRLPQLSLGGSLGVVAGLFLKPFVPLSSYDGLDPRRGERASGEIALIK